MVVRVFVCAMALVTLAACVDRGVYDTPCVGDFETLLRCGRESGAADPSFSGDVAETATCRAACELFLECGILWDEDVNECTLECEDENVSQVFLDCVIESGCNFEACFVGGL